jgi:hypothetical protein
MREMVQRTQVDKTAKVFNVGDEFIMHVFNAHLKANICQLLNITAPSDAIPHLCTQQWLRETAEMIVTSSIMPKKTNDPVHSLHRSFIHLGYLYVDLREAIRWENGPHIIRHWKF